MKFNTVILGLLFIIILCSILKKKNNIENYTILGEDGGPADYGKKYGGYEKIGSSYNAKQCQDECEKDTTCKYVNRPAHLKNWQKGECWVARDLDQQITGKKTSGNNGKPMKTWYNEKYVKPPPSIYKGSFGGYRYRSRMDASNKCKSLGLQLCHSTQLTNRKNHQNKTVMTNDNVCNSGWATDKRGWWVGRWRGWGCGGHGKNWNSWHSWAGSSAHCCTLGPVE